MDKTHWHIWFAWHPVAFGPYRAWLKPVQRRWCEVSNQWLYRRNRFPL